MPHNIEQTNPDNIYLFKVRDYTTILVGRLIDDEFVIHRGDGNIVASYHIDRIVWRQKLTT